MTGRPGLYDELHKYGLLGSAWRLMREPMSDTQRADLIDLTLSQAGGDFRVTPRAVYLLRHRLRDEPEPEPAEERKRKKPNAGSFKPGNPGGPGAPIGNQNAVKTGVYRNPFIHDPEDAEAWGHDRITSEVQQRIVALYDKRIRDQTKLQGRTKYRLQQLRAEAKRLEARLADLEEAIEITKERRQRATDRLAAEEEPANR